MGGWRFKLIFLLIIYFSGYATAIYNATPAPDNYVEQYSTEDSINPDLNSEQFMHSFNSGLHKCVGFAKDITIQAGRFIRQKIEERCVDS